MDDTLLSKPFSNYESHGQISVMTEAEMQLINASFLGQSGGSPVQDNLRLVPASGDYFDLPPRNPGGQSRSQCLQGRFLGGKPGRQSTGTVRPGTTCLPLTVGIYAVQESLTTTGQHVFNALDYHQIDTDTDDHLLPPGPPVFGPASFPQPGNQPCDEAGSAREMAYH